jgi:hypothetical protein
MSTRNAVGVILLSAALSVAIIGVAPALAGFALAAAEAIGWSVWLERHPE